MYAFLCENATKLSTVVPLGEGRSGGSLYILYYLNFVQIICITFVIDKFLRKARV